LTSDLALGRIEQPWQAIEHLIRYGAGVRLSWAAERGIATFRTVTLRTATVNPGHLMPRHFIPTTFNPGDT